MSQVVMYISFKLKKGTLVSDFLEAAENLNNGYMSKQKGFIEWKQLVEGDLWADLITWETMSDAEAILDPKNSPELAQPFYACLNMNSCSVRLYTVAKNYK